MYESRTSHLDTVGTKEWQQAIESLVMTARSNFQVHAATCASCDRTTLTLCQMGRALFQAIDAVRTLYRPS